MNKKELNFKRQPKNFMDYNYKNALFKTKFVDSIKHNGEIVKVIGLLKGKDVFSDRFIVLFEDGTTRDDIYISELDFDYENKKIQKNKKIKEER